MKLTPWEPDLRTLVDRIELKDIDLQPEFQRQEVWSIPKKRRLIDTVIRGWSIPPVHLIMTIDNKLEVLDGQQRLAALRDFLSGRFSIDGSITPVDDHVMSLHGKFYKTIGDAVRRRIDHYPLRCFRISDFSPEEPSELFYRLNQPTMLTAGEQRNALYGPARVDLKDLVQEFVSLGNDRQSIGFSNSRLSYDDIIARLLFFIELGSFGVKGSEGRISERFRSKTSFDDRVIARALCAIQLFSQERSLAGPVRLNKASLLSWLLFYSRFPSNFEPDGYLSFFVKLKSDESPQSVGPVLLFEDRSSLRVTDVSSVVLRDIVLWYVYSQILHAPCPEPIPTQLLEEVRGAFFDHGTSFESIVTSVIDIDLWSETL